MVYFLILALQALNFTDVVLTKRALELGVTEAWPVTAALIAACPETWAAIKILVVALLSVFLLLGAKQRWVRIAVVLLVLFYSGVVTYSSVFLSLIPCGV